MLEQEGSRLCAACGASNATHAGVCGVCGAALLGEVHLEASPFFPEGASTEQWPEPLPAVQAPAQTETVEQKRCGWCSAMNPKAAAVCESCGARFPTPEQDAAYLRASEERLRAEEAAIDLLRAQRLRRNRWGLRWRWRIRW